MAQIQFAKRQLNIKIAYCGPAGAGKATALALLQEQVTGSAALHAVELEGEEAFTTSFAPSWIEPVRELRVNLQLFCDSGGPGTAQRLLLEGADAVVFVADSTPDRHPANLEARAQLEADLRATGEELAGTILALMLNKRDVKDALPLDRLMDELALPGAEVFESVARTGRGVLEPLQAVARRVVAEIAAKLDAGAL